MTAFISATAEIVLSDISFNYTDCTVTLVFDPETGHVKSVGEVMFIDISANVGGIFGDISARIVDNLEFSGIVYEQ